MIYRRGMLVFVVLVAAERPRCAASFLGLLNTLSGFRGNASQAAPLRHLPDKERPQFFLDRTSGKQLLTKQPAPVLAYV
jgi:hypothetical protein